MRCWLPCPQHQPSNRPLDESRAVRSWSLDKRQCIASLGMIHATRMQVSCCSKLRANTAAPLNCSSLPHYADIPSTRGLQTMPLSCAASQPKLPIKAEPDCVPDNRQGQPGKFDTHNGTGGAGKSHDHCPARILLAFCCSRMQNGSLVSDTIKDPVCNGQQEA